MALRVYVDESERSTYVLCAVVVPTEHQRAIRQALRRLVPAGASRLHAGTDSDRLRKAVLSLIAQQPVHAMIYRSAIRRAQEARAAELTQLALDAVKMGADQLVIEARAAQDQLDRHTIALALNPIAGSARNILPFEHRSPDSEPLLWMPDYVAWAFGRGQDWRTRVQAVVDGCFDCA